MRKYNDWFPEKDKRDRERKREGKEIRRKKEGRDRDRYREGKTGRRKKVN